MQLPSPLDELHEAVSLVIHESIRANRKKDTAKIQARLKKQMARAFKAQGRDFKKRFATLKKDWSNIKEAVNPRGPEWGKLFDLSAQQTISTFQGPIDQAVAAALAAGGRRVIAELSASIAFDLENPRAVAYMKDRGAEMVTKINETTRKDLSDLLSASIENGDSYGDIARGISEMFGDDFPDWRAEMIARTETGNAYCQGSLEAARQMSDAGLEMEKSWLTAGDEKVEGICEENEADGWISVDDDFSSGDDAPLAHPNCRCDIEVRVKPDELKAEAPEAA